MFMRIRHATWHESRGIGNPISFVVNWRLDTTFIDVHDILIVMIRSTAPSLFPNFYSTLSYQTLFPIEHFVIAYESIGTK